MVPCAKHAMEVQADLLMARSPHVSPGYVLVVGCFGLMDYTTVLPSNTNSATPPFLPCMHADVPSGEGPAPGTTEAACTSHGPDWEEHLHVWHHHAV